MNLLPFLTYADFIPLRGENMLEKKDLISAVETLPENSSLEEVIQKINLLENINQGLEDVLNNRTYTHEQVMQMMKEWSKSDGHKEQ